MQKHHFTKRDQTISICGNIQAAAPWWREAASSQAEVSVEPKGAELSQSGGSILKGQVGLFEHDWFNLRSRKVDVPDSKGLRYVTFDEQ